MLLVATATLPFQVQSRNFLDPASRRRHPGCVKYALSMSETGAFVCAILCSSSLLAQAVNTTPSPRDQNYVLFGKKSGKNSGGFRAVRGRVLDSAGAPVSGATVQLNESPDGKGRSVMSGKDGSFQFDDLSLTQDYELKAAYKVSSSRPRTISQYDTRKTVILELRVEQARGTANK